MPKKHSIGIGLQI